MFSIKYEGYIKGPTYDHIYLEALSDHDSLVTIDGGTAELDMKWGAFYTLQITYEEQNEESS